MAINGNAAAPIIFLVIFNVVQFALRFWLMNWSYKLGTSAIDALTANMQAFTRAASIMGVFVVGLPGRHHGWHPDQPPDPQRHHPVASPLLP